MYAAMLATRLADRHIRVTPVHPDHAGVIADQPESAKQRMRAGSPFNRLGTPADVASVVAFPASAEGTFVHGHHLAVNGGSIY
jgi:3-oxoacyl-[acyl-carrier protein] reductase